MSITITLYANGLGYPEGGGNLWVYLNWALGLRALGCEVIWLEGVTAGSSGHDEMSPVTALRNRLERYGLDRGLALCSSSGEPLPRDTVGGCLDLEAAAGADLLLNLGYGSFPNSPKRFKRTALVDIDPGLTQVWMHLGKLHLPRHDLYFTIGETVGELGARVPDVGLNWLYTPPCIALDWWPPHLADKEAPFSTVSHWRQHSWMVDAGEVYLNEKRSGFLPFLDLPRLTSQPLELALCLDQEDDDRTILKERGWRILDSLTVASTPWAYQRYIQASRGEFSCAKPSCVRLQNAWISDRTVCYLASGKPAIVQHTGASRFLPESAGLFRFRDLKQAARYVEFVANDYERQCALARKFAEAHFDAQKVLPKLLERAL